ncbi:hypothetical protein OROGR_017466 [Orobanche gracilis]
MRAKEEEAHEEAEEEASKDETEIQVVLNVVGYFQHLSEDIPGISFSFDLIH